VLLHSPAIFLAVPGAFFDDFHHGPIDLESGHFYRRRSKEFDECLAHLEASGYAKIIWKVFKEKWGVQSPFVRWHHLDKTLLQWALDCFPAAHLRAWFEWILRDVKENRAGFPDLVQFYPKERTYRMIEVKGPGIGCRITSEDCRTIVRHKGCRCRFVGCGGAMRLQHPGEF
jgi:VRR-NUC domain